MSNWQKIHCGMFRERKSNNEGRRQIMWDQESLFILQELRKKGYEKIEPVGEGAFSVVLRVWDRRQCCHYACKVSRLSVMAKREAHFLEQLRHPVFPLYRTAWESGQCFFLVMEYIFGSTVGELCEKRGGFTQRAAVNILLELSEGICYLHERDNPIFFRDIKPENVMIRQDGRVKLVDLGCAWEQGEKMNVAGSRGLSAPEQFERGAVVGAESDVYALGRLLLFLLTGRSGGTTVTEQMGCGRKKQISPKLLQLIQKATGCERQKRIPDVKTLIKQLSLVDKNCLYLSKKEKKRAEIGDFYYMQNIRKGMDKPCGL